MAMTLDEIRSFMKKRDLKYFVDPEGSRLFFGMTGSYGRYQFYIALDVDGQFLQFRTGNYLTCPLDHPHLLEVLKVLGSLNYTLRFVKFGWDASDGEVVVYGDTWVMNGKVTWEQFDQMLSNYISVVDTNFERLKTTLETGEDPGEKDKETMIREMMERAGDALPPELKALLEKLGKKPEVTDI
jgi:hypothetical protein